MAESLDNGEFWLPPQFLLDDDTVHMEKYSANNLKSLSAKDVFGYPETEYGKSLIPYEFPLDLVPLGFLRISVLLLSPWLALLRQRVTKKITWLGYLARCRTSPLKMISRETTSLAAPKRPRYCFLYASFKNLLWFL